MHFFNIRCMWDFGGSKTPPYNTRGKQSVRQSAGCSYPGSCPNPKISKKLAGRFDLPVPYIISLLRTSRFCCGGVGLCELGFWGVVGIAAGGCGYSEQKQLQYGGEQVCNGQADDGRPDGIRFLIGPAGQQVQRKLQEIQGYLL